MPVIYTYYSCHLEVAAATERSSFKRKISRFARNDEGGAMQLTWKAPKGERGYTLLEVLIAVGIATIAFTSMGFILSNGFLLASDNRQNLYSVNALREQIETIRTTDYDSITNGTFANAQLAKLPSGAGTVTIASSFGPDIKVVTLTVSWTSRSGRTITESATTSVTRIGINRA